MLFQQQQKYELMHHCTICSIMRTMEGLKPVKLKIWDPSTLYCCGWDTCMGMLYGVSMSSGCKLRAKLVVCSSAPHWSIQQGTCSNANLMSNKLPQQQGCSQRGAVASALDLALQHILAQVLHVNLRVLHICSMWCICGRGKSVEEVWQAIHCSSADGRSQTAAGESTDKQQGLARQRVQQEQPSPPSSLQNFQSRHDSTNAGHLPSDRECYHEDSQQEAVPQGSFLSLLHRQRADKDSRHDTPAFPTALTTDHRRAALATEPAARSLPQTRAQPVEGLQWPSGIPSAPLSAALPGSMPLVWSTPSSPIITELCASGPAAASASMPAPWADAAPTVPMPAAGLPSLPGYPRSSRQPSSVQQHPNLNIPKLPALQVWESRTPHVVICEGA